MGDSNYDVMHIALCQLENRTYCNFNTSKEILSYPSEKVSVKIFLHGKSRRKFIHLRIFFSFFFSTFPIHFLVVVIYIAAKGGKI
jgi:hypothetical protein